jgi:hypothetical protein
MAVLILDCGIETWQTRMRGVYAIVKKTIQGGFVLVIK